MARKEEIVKILDEIGEKESNEQILQNLKVPSGLAQKDDKDIISKADKQLSKWKEKLSEKQIERILRIVRDFELDFYTDKIEPYYDKLKNF